MRQYFKQVDLRSRKAMTSFLEDHFRYPTMNSWNNSTSYANNMKVYKLGLPADMEEKLYQMLDVNEFYEELRYLIDEFDESHNYLWQAGFNGRSGGYLVLYQGFAKPSEYKSYCRKCGQKNYKSITENGNKCGRCGAEARIDFIKPPLQIGTYPGKSTDMDEDFEEWDIYSLRKRVKLVQEFDRLCDDLLARTVEMLEQYDVVEETVMRPEKIKVLSEVAS